MTRLVEMDFDRSVEKMPTALAKALKQTAFVINKLFADVTPDSEGEEVLSVFDEVSGHHFDLARVKSTVAESAFAFNIRIAYVDEDAPSLLTDLHIKRLPAEPSQITAQSVHYLRGFSPESIIQMNDCLQRAA